MLAKLARFEVDQQASCKTVPIALQLNQRLGGILQNDAGQGKPAAGQLETGLPRITELADGYAIRVEPGICILFHRIGDSCRVEIVLSEQGQNQHA
jgi:hypothetical protein